MTGWQCRISPALFYSDYKGVLNRADIPIKQVSNLKISTNTMIFPFEENLTTTSAQRTWICG